jgi:putative mycofactocin binding protein MftB
MTDAIRVRFDRAYDVDAQVAIRPEPFGALCYHYGNRRLTFLRSPEIVAVVEALAGAASLVDAFELVGVAEARRPAFIKALDQLAASGMIHERASPVAPTD